MALARGHCPNIVSRAFATAAVPVATATLAALAMCAAQAPVSHVAPRLSSRPSSSASRPLQRCLMLHQRGELRRARASAVCTDSAARSASTALCAHDDCDWIRFLTGMARMPDVIGHPQVGYAAPSQCGAASQTLVDMEGAI